jgi:AmiR/NasT family two-component response regulator
MAPRTELGRLEPATAAPPDAAPAVARIAELEVEVEHLRKALASRDVIGQAKGILMERFRVKAEEAFHLLVESSQRQNVRVADLSVQVADTGEWSGSVPA